MEQGIFYAVGVGAGNPLDMTLRAKQILEQADVIVIPVKQEGAKSCAYHIAAQAADMQRTENLELVFPMKSLVDYRLHLRHTLRRITNRLDAGKCVAMVTLGDVSVYSTATYVRQVLKEQGYATQVVAGLPSFCSGAAQAGVSLCENEESLLIMPAVRSKEAIEAALQQFDNLVVMKAGKALPDAYVGVPRQTGSSYFTTLLIKKGGLR